MSDIQKDNPSLYPLSFNGEKDLAFAYRKIEAISGAIFLVTNLILHTELIKTTLRAEALNCLSLAADAISNQKINVTELQKLAGRVNHLHSLLDIAFWSGNVSQMNSSLIQVQIGQVIKVMDTLIASNNKDSLLKSSFFDDSYKGHNVLSIGQDKGQKIKDSNVLYTPKKVLEKKPNESQSSRKEAILNLLAKKPDLTVKDFLEVIPGYSEKTIQRELISMVSSGMIKKQGERRWSTYSLI